MPGDDRTGRGPFGRPTDPPAREYASGSPTGVWRPMDRSDDARPILCVRVDLDYVPWDTPDAEEFGHGEPAMVLRLLSWADQCRVPLHFFASNRVLRAFPTSAHTIVRAGHDLDWLAKHPEQPQRAIEAKALLTEHADGLQGMALKVPWPSDVALPEGLAFVSCQEGYAPSGVRWFAVGALQDREAARSGASARSWADALRTHVRSAASLNRTTTIVVRPQVLARFDRRLQLLKEVVTLAQAVGLRVATLRDAFRAR